MNALEANLRARKVVSEVSPAILKLIEDAVERGEFGVVLPADVTYDQVKLLRGEGYEVHTAREGLVAKWENV